MASKVVIMVSEEKPLPGSLFLAKQIERRRFLRKGANLVFYGLAATAAGSVSLGTFLTKPAVATQNCCGSACCGPSPCCNTSCCNKPCCTYSQSSTCKNNGGTCQGFDTRHYPSACWSCVIGPPTCTTTTCCDCLTNNETGCQNTYASNRCICYKVQNICLSPDLKKAGVPASKRSDHMATVGG
jgi:hypothetical protein